ncbi:hypothetical protein MTO96_012359 [Rhipicephalus appendiculatus]
MPEVVLLRDFEDGVPKDFRVSFCESLPQDALCILCENVSARLYRDPQGHGYCRSCREMCKREDMFNCATCEEEWYICEVAVCSYCKESIPKKLIGEHLERCRQSIQNSLQYGETHPEMSADFSEEREMSSCELAEQLNNALSKICDLEEEIAQVRSGACGDPS